MRRALVALLTVPAIAWSHPGVAGQGPPAAPPAVAPGPAAAASGPDAGRSGYDRPPRHVLDVLRAPPSPQPLVSRPMIASSSSPGSPTRRSRAASVAAGGPSIQEAQGQSGESSTYELRDTLASKHDEDLFEYYATSQLALVDATTGAVTRVGEPDVLAEVQAAPDGQHLLVYSAMESNEQLAYEELRWFDRYVKDAGPRAAAPPAR